MFQSLCFILILISMITACGDGKDGTSCAVSPTDGGALISCDDGTQVEVPSDTVVIICKNKGHGPKGCEVQQ